MALSRLEITHFRNLQAIQIDADPGLNLITGENAAGKTSLLEAIFYLSYGRSFRGSNHRHLIQHNHDFFRLICQLDNNDGRIGIERSFSDQQIRVNQQNISRISDLSALLPVLALHPDSLQLITGAPEHRRQFMDWGVFHVEHSFLDYWKKYKMALSQRNAALRTQQPLRLCALWDNELVEYAEHIQQSRLAYLEQISEIIRSLSTDLFQSHVIELQYRRGWSSDLPYGDYLSQNLQRDHDKGFTQSGPHRADIRILVDDQPALSSISRGQQKKLVSLLKIAQLMIFSRLSDRRCILLFDDLPAELDQDNQNRIMSILSELNVQLFVTAIQSSQIPVDVWQSHKVFHVEQGALK